MTVRLTKDEGMFLFLFLSSASNDLTTRKDELTADTESCWKQMQTKKKSDDSGDDETRIEALQDQIEVLQSATDILESVCRKLNKAMNQKKPE